MFVLRRRRTTVRRTEQNQAFDEEIGKRPEQLQKILLSLAQES
jgi:hypothetical protein